MEFGEQLVTTGSAYWMPGWCADSLVTTIIVRHNCLHNQYKVKSLGHFKFVQLGDHMVVPSLVRELGLCI